MEFMQSENMGEKPENIRSRAKKIKEKLQEYRKKYNRIAIVSHFFTIRYLVCEEFEENGEPKCGLVMQNCASYSTSLSQISKYGWSSVSSPQSSAQYYHFNEVNCWFFKYQRINDDQNSCPYFPLPFLHLCPYFSTIGICNLDRIFDLNYGIRSNF